MCACLTRSAEARRKPGQQAVLRGSVRISAGLPLGRNFRITSVDGAMPSASCWRLAHLEGDDQTDDSSKSQSNYGQFVRSLPRRYEDQDLAIKVAAQLFRRRCHDHDNAPPGALTSNNRSAFQSSLCLGLPAGYGFSGQDSTLFRDAVGFWIYFKQELAAGTPTPLILV
jgi:hypothetical protein